MSRLLHKRILVTGGAGFLGSHIVEILQKERVQNIFVPRSSQYNLVQMDHVQRLYDDARPDIVIHLLQSIPADKPVSLEREILPSWVGKGLWGFPCSGEFVDLGTPEGFRETQELFSTLTFS